MAEGCSTRLTLYLADLPGLRRSAGRKAGRPFGGVQLSSVRMEGAAPPAAPGANSSPGDGASEGQAPLQQQQQQQQRHGLGQVVFQQERHKALEEYVRTQEGIGIHCIRIE